MVMEEAEITNYSCPFFCHARDDNSGPAVIQSSCLGNVQKGTRILHGGPTAPGPLAVVAQDAAGVPQQPEQKARKLRLGYSG